MINDKTPIKNGGFYTSKEERQWYFMYSAKNNSNNEQINTRLLVLDMLLAVTRPSQNGQCEYSHVVVREVLNKYNYLSQQEKAFIKRLFEGTLERMIELDYVINV